MNIELTENELNALPLDEQAEYLFKYAVSKNTDGKWKYSNCPVAKDSKPRFKARWKETIKKKHDETGQQITAWFILQYWKADTIARKRARDNKQWVSEPVGAAYWIKEERWNNGTIILEEQKKVVEGEKCKCGQPVHGPDYKHCTYHENFDFNGKLRPEVSNYDKLVAYYKAHPELIGYTRQQHIDSMRKNLGKIGK